VLAGSLNRASPLLVRVTAAGEHTALAALSRLVARAADARPRIARLSDRTLAQARALHAQGRHAEALRVLEAVDVADPQRPVADALRSEIQRMVLAEIPTPNVTAEAAR